MRAFATFVWLAALLGLIAGFCGAVHPAGDSLAVFRPFFAVVLIVLTPLMGRAGWVTLLAGVAAMVPILWQASAMPGPGPDIVVYQKNLRFDLNDPGPVIRDIRDSGAGIVMLQEVSRRNQAVPDALRDSLPHQIVCRAHSVGAVAILSRWPFQDPPGCIEGSGLVTARIDTPLGPLGAAALHLHWPWPFQQAAQLDALVQRLDALPQPALVAGDFNMVPWSHALDRITAATRTGRAGPLRSTMMLKQVYPMVIDHVLVPEGWHGWASMRPRLGSDHNGLLVRLTRP